MRRRFELEAAARFDELAGRLADHGASDVVLAMARESSHDELRHAELCRSLVEHFGGSLAPVPSEPPRVTRIAPAGLEGRDALLYELVALSCVTETLSTALLGALVEAARDSVAKEAMHAILRDEVRHSRLGWAYLAEAHAAGARDVVGPHLPAMLAATIGTELFHPSEAHPGDDHLTGYGVLDRAATIRVTKECFERVVFPGVERFGIDASGGRRWLSRI